MCILKLHYWIIFSLLCFTLMSWAYFFKCFSLHLDWPVRWTHTALHHHHRHHHAEIRSEPDYTCNNSLRIQSISGGVGVSADHRFSLNEMTNNWSFINNSRWKLDDLLPLLHKVGWSLEQRDGGMEGGWNWRKKHQRPEFFWLKMLNRRKFFFLFSLLLSVKIIPAQFEGSNWEWGERLCFFFFHPQDLDCWSEAQNLSSSDQTCEYLSQSVTTWTEVWKQSRVWAWMFLTLAWALIAELTYLVHGLISSNVCFYSLKITTWYLKGCCLRSNRFQVIWTNAEFSLLLVFHGRLALAPVLSDPVLTGSCWFSESRRLGLCLLTVFPLWQSSVPPCSQKSNLPLSPCTLTPPPRRGGVSGTSWWTGGLFCLSDFWNSACSLFSE